MGSGGVGSRLTGCLIRLARWRGVGGAGRFRRLGRGRGRRGGGHRRRMGWLQVPRERLATPRTRSFWSGVQRQRIDEVGTCVRLEAKGRHGESRFVSALVNQRMAFVLSLKSVVWWRLDESSSATSATGSSRSGTRQSSDVGLLVRKSGDFRYTMASAVRLIFRRETPAVCRVCVVGHPFRAFRGGSV